MAAWHRKSISGCGFSDGARFWTSKSNCVPDLDKTFQFVMSLRDVTKFEYLNSTTFELRTLLFMLCATNGGLIVIIITCITIIKLKVKWKAEVVILVTKATIVEQDGVKALNCNYYRGIIFLCPATSFPLKLAKGKMYVRNGYDGDSETVNVLARRTALKHWVATEICWYKNVVLRGSALLPVSAMRLWASSEKGPTVSTATRKKRD